MGLRCGSAKTKRSVRVNTEGGIGVHSEEGSRVVSSIVKDEYLVSKGRHQDLVSGHENGKR